MTLTQLRNLRHELNNLFYVTCENLDGDQRLAFRAQISYVDSLIEKMQEF